MIPLTLASTANGQSVFQLPGRMETKDYSLPHDHLIKHDGPFRGARGWLQVPPAAFSKDQPAYHCHPQPPLIKLRSAGVLEIVIMLLSLRLPYSLVSLSHFTKPFSPCTIQKVLTIRRAHLPFKTTTLFFLCEVQAISAVSIPRSPPEWRARHWNGPESYGQQHNTDRVVHHQHFRFPVI